MLANERLTVKTALLVPELPSTTLTSLMEIAGPSSLPIVPVPSALVIVPELALERWTVNVSFASSVVSPQTGTVTVWVPLPEGNVRLPLLVWKSFAFGQAPEAPVAVAFTVA